MDRAHRLYSLLGVLGEKVLFDRVLHILTVEEVSVQHGKHKTEPILHRNSWIGHTGYAHAKSLGKRCDRLGGD